jgi:hypothetical protein
VDPDDADLPADGSDSPADDPGRPEERAA